MSDRTYVVVIQDLGDSNDGEDREVHCTILRAVGDEPLGTDERTLVQATINHMATDGIGQFLANADDYADVREHAMMSWTKAGDC